MTSRLQTFMIVTPQSTLHVDAMNSFIRSSPFVVSYWNYIPFVYCIKTFADATAISSELRRIFFGGFFVVAEINDKNIDGALPQPAWDWFYRNPYNDRLANALIQRPDQQPSLFGDIPIKKD